MHLKEFCVAIHGVDMVLIPYPEVFIEKVMKIDIHSHHLLVKPGQKEVLAIEASFSNDFQATLARYGESVFLSVGIHPWSASLWDLNAIPFLLDVFLDSKVHLIGEIGLDKVSSVPFETQLLVFKTQLEMAEKAKKPVLLHAVRSMSEIIEIKKHFPAIPLWIIHGFRGGKQAAEEYIKNGFYFFIKFPSFVYQSPRIFPSPFTT